MTPSPEEQFIETLGLIFQAEGVPRISGQVLAYLVLAGDSRSLTEIAQALGVSKASVSTNVRQLEARGATERDSRIGSRQDLWRAVADPHHRVLGTMAERFDRNADRMQDIAAGFAGDPDKQQRVGAFGDFYRQSAKFLRTWFDAVGDGSEPGDIIRKAND
ncbi:hypothetical protein OB2597_19626 [Pseudooceanicola batsensis HTCC2597]|uniref:HTH marR-type domain-containing protein n=1 Tax=Pseudooceanicola batsensis (strain ATCC BAA-863 / DSM 15984 / KCTC 12145 / HTCC2597) TaxID=252305 RepID=A3U0N5_PSEBH|nr:MarR family transcriptional regulator [Pseudooceanicola batsensis]EAQ02326.1 hypothetical protein OB2597_19626 [Pseudooceanicola batsensis HTCC2597]